MASANPFDVKAALLAGHAQHPVIIHFPIALFIASVVFELLAVMAQATASRNGRLLQSAGCRADDPHCNRTGLGAWQWQLEGATIKGNLRLHMICAADFRVADLFS